MEVFVKLLEMTFWEKLANFHGSLAMLSLILFGAAIVLYFVVRKSGNFINFLKGVLLLLFVNLSLLDIFGLTIYMPYRAAGGPRSILKASESTAWLHNVVFEHKEFLAFAPPILILVAFLITVALARNFNDEKFSRLRKGVIFSLVTSLIFVLIVAAEAVLVTKAAPVK